jgi:diguanylate cyclase (GGDEF)-like protein
LQRRLYESSVRDPLTHAFNRAYFADRLMVEIAVAHRGDGETSLLKIDLDGLKQVNDRHGHLSGDRALSFVAARIASVTRMGDVLARYGGDEFVVLAGHTSLAQALVLAERVRHVVEQLCFAAGGERVAMTVSIGVASLREIEIHGGSGEAVVALADERLYAAKRAGKNRVHPA